MNEVWQIMLIWNTNESTEGDKSDASVWKIEMKSHSRSTGSNNISVTLTEQKTEEIVLVV